LKNWGGRVGKQDSKGKEQGLATGAFSKEMDLRFGNEIWTEVFVGVLLN
jgi:hypothetical protein